MGQRTGQERTDEKRGEGLPNCKGKRGSHLVLLVDLLGALFELVALRLHRHNPVFEHAQLRRKLGVLQTINRIRNANSNETLDTHKQQTTLARQPGSIQQRADRFASQGGLELGELLLVLDLQLEGALAQIDQLLLRRGQVLLATPGTPTSQQRRNQGSTIGSEMLVQAAAVSRQDQQARQRVKL
jgi:hypothetical protein